jgi:hypothetical protein
MIPQKILEKSWLMFEADSVNAGVEPSKLDFMMGASTLVGILTGRFDIGIPPNTPPGDILIQLMQELSDIRAELKEMEAQARDRTARMNAVMGHNR